MYGLFAAVFLAMRTVLGEQTHSTLGFSTALPVPLRRVAAVRLGGAVFVLVVPILLGAALLSIALVAGLVSQAAERALTVPCVGLAVASDLAADMVLDEVRDRADCRAGRAKPRTSALTG